MTKRLRWFNWAWLGFTGFPASVRNFKFLCYSSFDQIMNKMSLPTLPKPFSIKVKSMGVRVSSLFSMKAAQRRPGSTIRWWNEAVNSLVPPQWSELQQCWPASPCDGCVVRCHAPPVCPRGGKTAHACFIRGLDLVFKTSKGQEVKVQPLHACPTVTWVCGTHPRTRRCTLKIIRQMGCLCLYSC